jgi:microfibrillar-associated protein 1
MVDFTLGCFRVSIAFACVQKCVFFIQFSSLKIATQKRKKMRPTSSGGGGKKGTNNPAWAERNAVDRSVMKATGGGGGGRDTNRGAKITRYRAGIAPEWAKGGEDDSSSSSSSSSGDEDEEEKKLEMDATTTKKKKQRDEREKESSSSSSSSEAEREESESSESEDEDARDRKRALLKEKLLKQKSAALLTAAAPEEASRPPQPRVEEVEAKVKNASLRVKEESASGSSGSEYETDTDEESDEDESSSSSDGGGPKLFKPVFVSKAKREANAKAELAARNEAEKDEDELEEEKMIKKQNAKEAVQREITLEYQREVAEKDYLGEEVNTDSDEEDEEEARKNYEQWKMREFKRIVRDRCKQRVEMEEEEERERLRNMTEEERELHATKLKALKDAKEQGKEKTKMRFMQKYYHKGAFFQEAGDDEFATTEKAEIFNRDFNEATNAEKGVDRSTVPEAMRLRHGQFGKAGRSKWTHLSNEDTTFVNTEDVRLRNAQEARMKQKELEEQANRGAEGEEGGGEKKGGFRGTRLTVDRNVEKILDAKRAGMKANKK